MKLKPFPKSKSKPKKLILTVILESGALANNMKLTLNDIFINELKFKKRDYQIKTEEVGNERKVKDG